uniref:Multidrug resistance-associated protein n=1 Tax=Meloidogyne hapla TaxID=6305 RepID=A0A1I8B942_MELHA
MESFCVNENTPLFAAENRLTNGNSSTIPRISECYQQTTLYALPALFLLLFSPLVIYDFKKSTKGPLLRRTPTTLRIFLCGFLLINVLIQIVYFSATFTWNENLNPSLASNGALPIAKFLALLLLGVSLFLALILMLGCRRFGLATSGVLFNYWLLLAVCGIPRFREAIELWFGGSGEDKDHFAALLLILYYVVVLKISFISCFADRSRNDEINQKTCPEPSVSFLNRILFVWFDSIARLGNMRALIIDDLWQLSERDKSKHLTTKFEKIREKQFNSFNQRKIKRRVKPPLLKKNQNGIEETELLKTNENKSEYSTNKNEFKENSSPPSLIWALFLTFKFSFFGAIFYKIIHDLLQFAPPKLLDLLLQFIETPEANIWNGIGIAICMFLLNFIQSMFIHQYFHIMFRVGMNIRSILTSAIYKKALLLSSSARTKRTIGEIVNLMTVDIQRFQDMASWINFLWSAPLQVLLSIFFLFQLLGISVIAGLICLVAFVPINAILSLAMRTFQQKQMALKDERLKLMNEILNGIKVFKLYAWEDSIEDRILAIRKKELQLLRRIAYVNAISSMTWSCAPFLVAVSTFSAYLLLDPANNVLTPRITFVALSYFNILRFPLAIFPMVGSQAVQCNVSNKRMKTFLAEDELKSLPSNNSFGDSSLAISLRNASFSWSEEEPVLLKNLNIEIKRGSLVAVVGRIGSGKSSLLSAILGEMYCKSGTVEIDGQIAYVPQQAWIQNMSLKENILFGNSFNKQSYDVVIDACSLQQDLDSLPGGDSIEIGEKGINLSGGQKQRISLARAAYLDRDIYFLDDPLSAVDSHVGKHIFDKLIGSENGLLKAKTRVLVTHGLSFLKHCDQIIVVKDGQVTESGSYHDLLKSSGELSEIIEEYVMKQQSTTDISEEPDDEMMDVLDELEKIHPEKSLPRLSARRVTTESETSGKTSIQQKESITTIPQKRPTAKIIEKEEVLTGKVKFGVYLEYLRAIGWISLTFFIFIYLFSSVLGFACNLWLAKWSDQAEAIQKGNSTFSNETKSNLIIYTSLGIAQAFTVTFGSIIMAIGMIKAGRKLHQAMLKSVLRSPMSWFDITPLGRIMNRFGKDVDSLDSEIPRSFTSFLRTLLASAETLAMISYATPQFLLCVTPLAIFYGLVLRYYESVQGASSIRAYNCVERFLSESQKRVDNNMVIYFSSIVANRWLAVRLELVGNLIVFFSAFSAVLFRHTDHVTAGLVGLSVSYALSVTQVLNWAVRMASELETNIVSVERIKEYKETPNEAALETPSEVFNEKKGEEFWPENGEILIDNIALRYRQNLDLVLKDVNAHILPHEKIGIVGRTGAGKSSLVLALFRLVEPASGKIIIDGIDISKLGLKQLRSRLTIVPQDPVLFSGTFRENLDPFGKHSDDGIWTALKLTHLDEFVNTLPNKLDHKISEGGGNLSVGQRQLICLARAVLRQSKILVLDEAAASVDLETDHLIQQTIRRQFVDCTVLTIAHRLHSVLDSTRILVFSEGRVAEFDTPINLFSRQDSLFRSLALDAGINSIGDVVKNGNNEEKNEEKQE